MNSLITHKRVSYSFTLHNNVDIWNSFSGTESTWALLQSLYIDLDRDISFNNDIIVESSKNHSFYKSSELRFQTSVNGRKTEFIDFQNVDGGDTMKLYELNRAQYKSKS